MADTRIVTIDEVKADLRYFNTDKDNWLEGLIDWATAACSVHQGRKYLSEACVDKLDAWPADGVIRPKWAPLVSVTHITYIDTAGVEQTWDASEYDVDGDSFVGRITPAYGESFPSARSQINAIAVTYQAGYGDVATAVPENVKIAVRMLVFQKFHGLLDMDKPESPGLPRAVVDLLGYERIITV